LKKSKHPNIYYYEKKGGARTYYVRVQIGGDRRYILAGSREKDALQKLIQIQNAKADGKAGIVRPIVVPYKNLAKEYLEYYRTKAKPRNWARVDSIFKHLLSFFGEIEIRKITAWTVENYIRDRKKAGVTNRTINVELDYLRASLNKAVEWSSPVSTPI